MTKTELEKKIEATLSEALDKDLDEAALELLKKKVETIRELAKPS